MPLFQSTILKKYTNALNTAKVDEAFARFTAHFHNPVIQENIRLAKEEQYQGEFLIDLFVRVLGYVKNPTPDFNLTTEFKNIKDSKKADGAIISGETAVGVIELKGTAVTDLGRIETQAFGYKNNQTGCVYVITSNFEKLRFYIDNAVDFEEFNLFQLSRERFDVLWLCLSAEELLAGKPKQLKEESLSQEEQITKQLYKDYSLFRNEVFQNIVDNNPQYDKLTLFKETQKLLDRFLFIFFAEDRLLLPPNSILAILQQWKDLRDKYDEYQPLYSRFKKYFGYLNTGHKGQKHDIFAYNGGLFKPDAILDDLNIDDELLYKHTENLCHYDFESEVSVNVLGHIFEHSLNEIEEIQAELEGQTVDKSSSKRKKDGVFYTPKYITKYIVDNTVGKLCTEQKTTLDIDEAEYDKGRKNRPVKTVKALKQKLDDYRAWLLQLTICDPACGSGAFLNQALEFLIAEHAWVDELHAKLFGDAMVLSDVENSILEHNLYGVDINNESVEIAKLSLWLRTAQKGRKLTSLNNNIKCGNSLIDDPAVAGDKAFNWKKEFPQVFSKGGFDVVIGNPPYVRAELLGEFIEYLSGNYKVFNSASDLFAYFYELGTKIIKPTVGILSFISNTFDKTTAGKVLREYLSSNTSFYSYIDFTEVQVFDGATTYPVIISFTNHQPKSNLFNYIKIPKSKQGKVIEIEIEPIVKVDQSSLNSDSWSFMSKDKNLIIEKIIKLPTVRDVYGKCYYGVKTALNEAFIVNKEWPVSEHIKYIYEGKEIKKWNTPLAQQKLILFKSRWTNEKYGIDLSEEELLSKLKQDFPEIINHLIPFQEKGKKRYDKGDYWWELRNCAYYDLFEKPKIIFPNLQNKNKFCLDSNGVFINAPAVFLPSDSKALLCILNSKLVWEFLKSICVVRSGGYIEVKPQYFEQIPVPIIKNEEAFERIAEEIIDKTSQLQKTVIDFINLLQSKFHIEKLTKNLQSWHNLDFKGFLKELKKAKVTLTLPEEAEWMAYFNGEKAKAQALQNDINRLDKEIDVMVYGLYGLTVEEIGIVEQS